MAVTQPIPFDDAPAYEAVSTIVSRSGRTRPVSVRETIATYRKAIPGSSLSDEELVKLIVRAATGRTKAVHFDGTPKHRAIPLG